MNNHQSQQISQTYNDALIHFEYEITDADHSESAMMPILRLPSDNDTFLHQNNDTETTNTPIVTSSLPCFIQVTPQQTQHRRDDVSVDSTKPSSINTTLNPINTPFQGHHSFSDFKASFFGNSEASADAIPLKSQTSSPTFQHSPPKLSHTLSSTKDQHLNPPIVDLIDNIFSGEAGQASFLAAKEDSRNDKL